MPRRRETYGTNSHEVLIALRRIIRAIDIHSRCLTKRYGLTGPQLLLMNEIKTAERVSVGALAEKAHLSQATVTNIVDRLENHSLLRRSRDVTDKRRVWVSLTEKGKETLAAGPQLLQEAFLERFNALSKEEQHSILEALRMVARMMDAEGLSAAPILDVAPLPEPEKPKNQDHEDHPNSR